MYASGITFTSVASVSPNPATVTSAADGLSISLTTPHQVILGQKVGTVGNPAKLLGAAEIPFNGFNLSLSGTSRLMIGTTVPDTTASALQVNNGISMFNWFMPLSDLAGDQGIGFINSNQFFHTYEPAPVIPGQPTSFFFGGGGAGNRTVTNTGSIVNIGLGFDVMTSITTAQNNVGLGIQALQALTSGFNNLGIGSGTLETLTDGVQCTAVGTQALQNAVHSTGSVGVGSSAGSGSTGDSNTFLGTFMGVGELGNNMLYIGADGFGTGVLPWIYANMNTGTFAGRWNGKLGVGFRTALPGLPTAQVHIAPGTAAAGTAPLKFTTGVNLGVVENGAVEYNNINLFFSSGGIRQTVFTGVDGAAAPATSVVVLPTTIFGGPSALLGTPVSWAGLAISGIVYKIPLYT